MTVRKWIGLGLGLGVLPLAAGCGGDDKGEDLSSEKGFVAYWTDGKRLCRKNDACGVQSEKACLAGWPTKAETLDALDAIGWSSIDRRECGEAARDLDDCYVGLSCDDVEDFNAGDNNPCSDEDEEYLIACRDLLGDGT